MCKLGQITAVSKYRPAVWGMHCTIPEDVSPLDYSLNGSLRPGHLGNLTPISPLGTPLYYSCESRGGAGWRCDVRVPTAPPTGLRIRSLHPNLVSNLDNQKTHVLKLQNEEVIFRALASMDSVVMTAQNGPHVSIGVCFKEPYGRVAPPISWGHHSLCLISRQKSYQK